MARAKFLCDAERCIECNACVTACKNEHEVPWGINRRKVVTINDGKPGERSISVACMHCSDAPCMAVCPVDCFYQTSDGVVLHSKDLCIGCGWGHEVEPGSIDGVEIRSAVFSAIPTWEELLATGSRGVAIGATTSQAFVARSYRSTRFVLALSASTPPTA